MAKGTCSSCGVNLLGVGTVVFNCPSCGQTKFGRCARCRDQSVHYRCGGCSFLGP